LRYRDRLNYNWNQIYNAAHLKYGSMIDELQFPEHYDTESFLRHYIQEIWLGELHPPEMVDTGKLINYVVSDDEHREIKFHKELKKMYPTVHDPERWWSELDNLNNAVQFVFKKEHESLPLSETFIKSVRHFQTLQIPPFIDVKTNYLCRYIIELDMKLWIHMVNSETDTLELLGP
jgi:hypothetical protein